MSVCVYIYSLCSERKFTVMVTLELHSHIHVKSERLCLLFLPVVLIAGLQQWLQYLLFHVHCFKKVGHSSGQTDRGIIFYHYCDTFPPGVELCDDCISQLPQNRINYKVKLGPICI